MKRRHYGGGTGDCRQERIAECAGRGQVAGNHGHFVTRAEAITRRVDHLYHAYPESGEEERSRQTGKALVE